MELNILSAWVPYIASELFHIIVQIEHGQLYIRLDSGAKGTFNTVRLTGASHDAAKKILGQVYTHFVQEVETEEVLINSITLKVKGDADMHSRLYIQGSVLSMAWIVSKLWPLTQIDG